MGWRAGIPGSVIMILIVTAVLSVHIDSASGDLKAEGEEGFWSATTIKEVFFKPTDNDIPPDRRYDLYEDRLQDWVFTWQVLEWDMNGTTGDPVPSGIVWLNITMGAYTNSTRGVTDICGRAHFSFSSRFKDTATGNTFMVTEDMGNGNLTIQIKFIGNNRYTESSKTYFCTYHTAIHGDYVYDSDPNYLCCFCGASFLIFASFPILLYYKDDILKRLMT